MQPSLSISDIDVRAGAGDKASFYAFHKMGAMTTEQLHAHLIMVMGADNFVLNYSDQPRIGRRIADSEGRPFRPTEVVRVVRVRGNQVFFQSVSVETSNTATAANDMAGDTEAETIEDIAQGSDSDSSTIRGVDLASDVHPPAPSNKDISPVVPPTLASLAEDEIARREGAQAAGSLGRARERQTVARGFPAPGESLSAFNARQATSTLHYRSVVQTRLDKSARADRWERFGPLGRLRANAIRGDSGAGRGEKIAGFRVRYEAMGGARARDARFEARAAQAKAEGKDIAENFEEDDDTENKGLPKSESFWSISRWTKKDDNGKGGNGGKGCGGIFA